MRGTGRVVFAAIMLLLVGTLNIIYGIGALDGANVFVGDQRYVLTDLNTLGWVLILLGVIQLAGGLSLMAGNTYGRVIGIIGGTLGAILTGVFATREINDVYSGKPMGWIDGNPGQVLTQLWGCLVCIAWCAVATFIILKIVDVVIGLRVTTEEEVEGLDINLHGETVH